MKKSILTVLFALCSTIGFAQVSFQVKAGLNLSSYIGENSDHSKFKAVAAKSIDFVSSIDYNRFDAGWNIGLGVEFGKILVGLDTQLGFCKVMDGNAPHNANIGITLGYKF